jgi:hypothetical protein
MRPPSGSWTFPTFNAIAAEAMRWTRRRLSVVNISWLESLKSSLDREDAAFSGARQPARSLEEYISTAKPQPSRLRSCSARFASTGTRTSPSSIVNNDAAAQFDSPLQNDDFLNGGQLELEAQQRYLVNPVRAGSHATATRRRVTPCSIPLRAASKCAPSITRGRWRVRLSSKRTYHAVRGPAHSRRVALSARHLDLPLRHSPCD